MLDLDALFPKDEVVVFAPEGARSFERRARWLASGTGLRPDAARRALATVYGHADVAAALEACRAVDEGRAAPGPFLAFTPPKVDALCLRTLLAELGGGRADALHPAWNHRDLALLSPEADAEAAHARVKAKVDALAGRRGDRKREPRDYGRLERTTMDEAVVAFTPLGGGVMDAVSTLVQAVWEGGLDWPDYAARMAKVQRAHPENPWVGEAATRTFLSFAGHDAWRGAGDRMVPRFVGSAPEPDPDEPAAIHLEAADPETALDAFGTVDRIVSEFERYFGVSRPIAPPKLVCGFRHGSDAAAYARALELAARLAADAGLPDVAEERLRRRIDLWGRGDAHAARRELALLLASRGRKGARDLLEADDATPERTFAWLLDALSSATRGRRAAEACADWLRLSPMAVRAVTPDWRACDGVEILTGWHRLAPLREVIHKARAFAVERPDAWAALVRVSRDGEVRAAHLAYHEKEASGFGCALRGEARPDTREEDGKLEAAVAAALG